MNITVLGKYGPFPKDGGATSSYLLTVGDKKILIDLGAGSFSRLAKFVKPERLDFVILSHFHFDHCSDFGVMTYYNQVVNNSNDSKKPVLFCPKEGGTLASTVIDCPYFDVKTVFGGEKIVIDGISFEFFSMNHPVKSVGVKINDGVKTFAYTGDTNLTDSLDLLYNGADLVLADGAFLYSDWNENRPHLSVKHIVELTEKWGNRSIISHINPKYDEKEIQKEIGEGNCEIAQEMTTYEV